MRQRRLDPIELARASFPLAGGSLALLGERGALNLVLATVVVYAIRRLRLPRPHDGGVLLAAAVLAWGDALDLYGRILYYDLLAHFLVQMLIAPAIYVLIARRLEAAESGFLREGALEAVVVVGAMGFSLGAFWEVVEWTFDGLLGTDFVKGEADTFTDLIADACGACVGAVRLAMQPEGSTARLAVEGDRPE